MNPECLRRSLSFCPAKLPEMRTSGDLDFNRLRSSSFCVVRTFSTWSCQSPRSIPRMKSVIFQSSPSFAVVWLKNDILASIVIFFYFFFCFCYYVVQCSVRAVIYIFLFHEIEIYWVYEFAQFFVEFARCF